VLGIQPGAGESDYTSGTLRFNMQAQVSGQATLRRNVGSMVPVRDVWYHIETLAVMNTVAGVADGIWRMWVDGELHMDYSDVLWTQAGGVLYWRRLGLDPYYGGNTPGHTIPTECYMYVDRWTVYSDTARS
jgi:hypothetical protein